MTVKETLDVINELIDCHILDEFAFTTVRYLYTDENVVILSDLATGVRDWVNNGHEDATVEEVAKEWCMAPATFKNFIENFQKVNWNNLFRITNKEAKKYPY